MKFNTFCILIRKINKNEIGQSLLESLIVYLLLFLSSFSVIEISRLIAFKNCLQSATSYIAHKIAYADIDIQQKNISSDETIISSDEKKIMTKKISSEIENYLNTISISLLSFDSKDNENEKILSIKKHDVRVYLKFVYDSNNIPSGIYIESQTCLPVPFSKIFKHFKSNSFIGGAPRHDQKTCLGHFNSSSQLPLSWHKVRVAAYSPWPVSIQILKHGISQPLQYEKIEQENKNDVLIALENHNLSDFFHSSKNKEMDGWSDE